MEQKEYEPIISEWVEGILNYKVKSIKKSCIVSSQIMEAALNHKLMTIEPIP
jgi:hypothetical protein